MRCPKCHFENIADAKFCNECGSKLMMACGRCGKVNPPGSKFCNECGHQLIEASATEKPVPGFDKLQRESPAPDTMPLTEGERRQATVVFSDLSGYTSMNERLDPEEVETIMSRIKKDAVDIVERHEGIVNQFVGDEVLALFGIPTAHEDDPVRAVRAARQIHSLVRQISTEVENRSGTELRMHTGISTGLIVTHKRDTREGSYGITGDTVNTGARLANLAEADQILVGPETYNLIRPYFKTSTLESVTVAGKTKPIIPHIIIGKSKVRTRFEAAKRQGLTEFIGRQRELTALYACLDRTLSGKGQFITVVGEAGLGKSRLIYELRHSLNRSEVTVLQGRCQAYGTSIPYFPHINALRRGLNLRDEDTPAELHQKTITNVLGIDPSLERYLPIYLHLLSIPSEKYQLSKHLHDQQLTAAIQEALTAIYDLSSKRRPMVLIFEDWHWADEASDAALKHMISLIASNPIMVLVIYRPDYAANWGHWSHHTAIILSALNNQNCSEIVKSVWNVGHLPEGIIPLIHDRTGGNPFFVEEISNALIEDGPIKIDDDRAVMTGPLEDLSLPNTVQAVIRARLDRLDDYTHESLRLASVIGREFASRILEKISTSKERLSQALERLKILELIQQIQVVPEAEYMFKHVITQEVTYETLLKKKRKELHGLVGRAIEELYADRLEEFYETLAFHFQRGEDWSRAYKYSRDAGLKAQSFSAYIEAQNYLETALEALNKLDRSKTHLKNEIDLRFNMRSALFPLGRHNAWADHIRKAELLAMEIGDKRRLANSYNYMSGYLWIRGRHNESIKLGEEGLHLAEAAGDFSVEVTTKLHLGIPLLYTGQIERQIELHREVTELLEGPAALRRHGFATVPAITARGYLAWGLSELGRFEEAEIWSQQGIELSGQVQNLLSTAFMHAASGLAYLRQGKIDTAFKLLQTANTLGNDADLHSFHSFVTGSLGYAFLLMGHLESALPALEEAVKPQNIKSSITPSVYPVATLAEAYRQAGRIELASRTIENALTIFRKTGESCFGAWALFVKARIQSEIESGQTDQAAHTYHQAIELAQKLKLAPLSAHCHLRLGQLLSEQGSHDNAHVEFQAAINQYRVLGMKFWLTEAEAMLQNSA